MVNKTTTKKPVKNTKKQTKIEKVNEEITEIEEEPTIKWKPVAKVEKKNNGNFFAKMVDFFHF